MLSGGNATIFLRPPTGYIIFVWLEVVHLIGIGIYNTSDSRFPLKRFNAISDSE